MIKAIALDDEPLALRLLRAFTKKFDFIELKAAFTSPLEAIKFIKKELPDLIFLDIEMPGINGIDFLKNLPSNTMVIFTTAYSEYAVQGFNLKAIDYLLKPFDFERFAQAVQRAKENFIYRNSASTRNEIFVKADQGITKIDLGKILYVESVNNYIKIYLTSDKTLLVRMSIKEMDEKLKNNGFMRVHRSYIIPLSKVKSIRGRMIYMGYMEIPIGGNFIKSVQDLFKKTL